MKILIYDDSAVMGGHEVMVARIANELSKRHRVVAIHHHPQFGELLSRVVRRLRVPFSTRLPMPILRNHHPIHIGRLVALFRKEAPDLVVVAQGNIELCTKGLLAGRIARLPTVSYIPLANTVRETGGRFPRLRAFARAVLYRVPDAFATVSSYQRELLVQQTCKPVRVIPNPARVDGPVRRNRESRAGRGSHTIHVGIVGRICFDQKNHGILVPLARLLEARGVDFRIHVIGDGPDRQSLSRKILSNRLGTRFVLHGWLDRSSVSSLLQSTIAVLLVPSHYESCLPLALLEAVAQDIPFLVSRAPFARQYDLPPELLVDQNDPEDIAEKLLRVAGRRRGTGCDGTRERILAAHSYSAFASSVESVFRAYEGELCRAPPADRCRE